MRGKGQPQQFSEYCKGITPAYAGKRFPEKSRQTTVRDHPRLCGEKEFPRNFKSWITGSPPPMRGKAFPHKAYVPAARITPAYAGKSIGDCEPDFRL